MKNVLIYSFCFIALFGCKEDEEDTTPQHGPHEVGVNLVISNSTNVQAFEFYNFDGDMGALVASMPGPGTDSSTSAYSLFIDRNVDEHPKTFVVVVKPVFYGVSSEEQCDIAATFVVDGENALEIPTQTIKTNGQIDIEYTVE